MFPFADNQTSKKKKVLLVGEQLFHILKIISTLLDYSVISRPYHMWNKCHFIIMSFHSWRTLVFLEKILIFMTLIYNTIK